MNKLQSFFLSKVLNKRIYDEDGDYVGTLLDIYVTEEEDYPRAIAYKLKKGREIYNYEFKDISFYDDHGKVFIKVRSTRDIILMKYSYLLSENLLNKPIIDIDGKKLVKVNDLRIGEIAGEYKVIAVDTVELDEEFSLKNIVKKLLNPSKKKSTNTLIMWDNVESLEIVNNKLQLSVPYQKLSKLHPADLADIMEDMNNSYRKILFESLDDDLAADTFEEIDSQVRAEMLEDMDLDEKIEVIYNMSKDEAADVLLEMDEEEAEGILSSMDDKDAEDLRKLMNYKDETCGSIMNKEFVSFNFNITVEETIELIREMKPKDDIFYYIYIVDKDNKLKGVVSLKNLILADLNSKLVDIMDTDVLKVKDTDDMKKAAEIAIKYGLIAIPVIEENNKLCGTIEIDDIIDDVLVPMSKNKI